MTQNRYYCSHSPSPSPLSLSRFSPVSVALCCCFSLCTHYTCAAHSYAHSHSAANKWESRIDNNNTETTDKESLHSELLGVKRACLCFARAVAVAVSVAVSVAVAVASLTWESPRCLLPIVVVAIIIIIAHKLLSNFMHMYVCVYVCLHTVTGFALSVNFGWFYWPASTFLSAGIASDATPSANLCWTHKKIIESKLKPIGIWVGLSGPTCLLYNVCELMARPATQSYRYIHI